MMQKKKNEKMVKAQTNGSKGKRKAYQWFPRLGVATPKVMSMYVPYAPGSKRVFNILLIYIENLTLQFLKESFKTYRHPIESTIFHVRQSNPDHILNQDNVL
jgi:hypothetical protein